MKKRFFSILLSLCMMLMLFPVTAFAEEEPTITINGPDVVCAQQQYKFTVTAADGITLTGEFGFDTGGKGSGSTLTLDENGVGHGVMSTEWYDLQSHTFELSANGRTADQRFVVGTKTVQVSSDHIFVDGICGCGAKQLTITYEYDYGTLPEGQENPDTIALEPSGTSICLPDLEDCGERQFLGWQIKNSDDIDVYPADTKYCPCESMTFVAVYEEYITLTVPFTTTVKLGGSAAPGKTTFDLAVVGTNAAEEDYATEENYADVTVSGSVTTNGAGEYDGTLTFTGPEWQLWYMLSEGAFVQQVDAGEEGWTYDNTVWGLSLEEKEIVPLASTDDAAPTYSVQVYTTIVEDSDNGPYYQINDTDPQDKMRFTNIYTKSTTEPTETTKPTSNTPTTNATTSVQTGDNSNLMLWLVLLAVSAAGVIGTGVYSRRRRSFRTK